MGAAVRQLEEAVRRDPTQWFQFAPFWAEPDIGRQLERLRDRRRVLPLRERGAAGEANAAQAVVRGEEQPPGAIAGSHVDVDEKRHAIRAACPPSPRTPAE